MRVYHGERTDQGCKVTVDGVPLRVRSDLSGASAAFDWGYVGNGQLSLALLSDLLGDEQRVKDLCKAFEREVVAALPRDAWTVTDAELAAAVATLAGGPPQTTADPGPPAAPGERRARVGFGDMPMTGRIEDDTLRDH